MGFFFFKQKTAYEIYQCDWSSDVCSSDLEKVGLRSLYRKYRADKPHIELDPNWNPALAKQIADNEKILEQRMERAWNNIKEANVVKKYISELKDVKYTPYKIV